MLINGIEYSWSNVRLMIAGVVITGVSSIKYSVKQGKVNNYGVGTKPVSRSYGIKEFEGGIALHMSEIEAITNAAPNRELCDVPPFDVTIAFVDALGRPPIVHNLRNCEFVNNTRDLQQGNAEKIEAELELVIGDIEW